MLVSKDETLIKRTFTAVVILIYLFYLFYILMDALMKLLLDKKVGLMTACH